VSIGGDPVPAPALVVAGGLAVALLVYPEWYVVDAVGVVVGMGAAGLFGISFGLGPALLLLVALAVYDAVSVYGTEHMLTLASGVMDLKLPVVLVVPFTLDYSFLDAETPDPTGDGEGADGAETGGLEDRGALFVGLGDAVIPSVLVASAAVFLPVGTFEVPSPP